MGNLGLDDVNSVVVQVKVDEALPDAVVFSRVLNHGLEEVGLEVKHLKVTCR